MSREFSDGKMAPPAAPAPQGTPCVLGPTLHFKGELYGEEDLEFQGQIEGSIEHTRSSEHRQGRRRQGQHPREIRDHRRPRGR